jgi:hypothetical protein
VGLEVLEVLEGEGAPSSGTGDGLSGGRAHAYQAGTCVKRERLVAPMWDCSTDAVVLTFDGARIFNAVVLRPVAFEVFHIVDVRVAGVTLHGVRDMGR